MNNPLPVRLPRRPVKSEKVCSNQGSSSPPPRTKRQKVRPCSVGAVPTSGRAARPEPRKNASSPVISTSNAVHSKRSSLCSDRRGTRVNRSTKEISAVLVDRDEERKTAPSNLLRDQRGTLVAVKSTPV